MSELSRWQLRLQICFNRDRLGHGQRHASTAYFMTTSCHCVTSSAPLPSFFETSSSFLCTNTWTIFFDLFVSLAVAAWGSLTTNHRLRVLWHALADCVASFQSHCLVDPQSGHVTISKNQARRVYKEALSNDNVWQVCITNALSSFAIIICDNGHYLGYSNCM